MNTFKQIIALILIVLVMLVAPLAVRLYVKGDGMIYTVILFYVVNPIFSVFLGRYAGHNVKGRWYMPILSSIIYLLSAWLIFDPKEQTFLIYASTYLVIGLAMMIIVAILTKYHDYKDNKEAKRLEYERQEEERLLAEAKQKELQEKRQEVEKEVAKELAKVQEEMSHHAMKSIDIPLDDDVVEIKEGE